MCIEQEGLRAVGCVLNLWLLPAICCVGLVLNVACLLVFAANRSHPLVPALCQLSCCDLLQLFFSLLVLLPPAIADFYEYSHFGWLGQFSFVATGLLSPLLLASNCASIWTITFISIQRHRAVTRPLSTVHSGPQVMPLFLITGVALLFNARKWAEFAWEWRELDGSEGGRPAGTLFLMHSPSAMAMNRAYRLVCDEVLYPLLVYLLPLVLLTGLHGRILCSISLAGRLRPLGASSIHRARSPQESRTSALLIAIVVLFFCCHTGGLVIRFVDSSYAEEDWYVVLKDFVNILFNFNSTVNPMLYFFFTRQFRDLKERVMAAHFFPSVNSARPSLANITQVTTVLLERRGFSDHSSRRFSAMSTILEPMLPSSSSRKHSAIGSVTSTSGRAASFGTASPTATRMSPTETRRATTSSTTATRRATTTSPTATRAATRATTSPTATRAATPATACRVHPSGSSASISAATATPPVNMRVALVSTLNSSSTPSSPGTPTHKLLQLPAISC